MDAQRSFPDDSESRWYPGEHGYADADWERRGERRYPPSYPDEGYRVPDQRGGEPGDHYLDDPRYAGSERYDVDESGRGPLDPAGRPMDSTGELAGGRIGVIGPRSGEPMPPPPLPPQPGGRGPGPEGGHRTEQIDRTALRRPAAAPVGDGVYRTRRPGAALLFGGLAAIFELPALRLLASAAFADKINGAGVIAATFLIIGLPLFALGMYGLTAGAGRVAEPGRGPDPGRAGDPGRAWLRPPVGYVTIALALFLAAALAI